MRRTIRIDNKVLKTEELKKLGAKGLALYFFLVRNANVEDEILTSLSFILQELQMYNDSKSKKEIINLLKIMEEIEIIDVGSLEGIRVNDMIKIQINHEGNYTRFYPKDFELFKKLGVERFKVFTVYCIIKAYHNEEYGYAFPTMDIIVEKSGFSKETVHKHIHLLEQLSILDIDNNGWRYDDKRGKHIRCNNMYYINYGGKKDIFNMSFDEVRELIQDIKERKVKRVGYEIKGKKCNDRENMMYSNDDISYCLDSKGISEDRKYEIPF